MRIRHNYQLVAVMILTVSLLVGSGVAARVHASTVISFDVAASTSIVGDGHALSWLHTVGSGLSRILVVGVAINSAEGGSTT